MAGRNQLRAPSRSRVFSNLLSSGITILAVGLAVPFIVGEPAGNAGAPSIAAPQGSATSGGGAATSSAGGATSGTGEAGADGSTTEQVEDAAGQASDGGTSAGDPSGTTSPSEPSTGGSTGGTESGATTGATTGEPTGSTTARTASDVGVTPDSIKLGILVLEDQEIEGMGSVSDFIGNAKQQWNVAIEAVNESGGINGRIVEPVFAEFDGLDPDDMRAACIYLTEQEKVFAVLNSGGYYGDPILCITEQHATPFIGQAGEILDFYRRSNGMYFSTTPNKDRVLLNKIQRMYDDGFFEGRTVGIVEQEGIDKIPVDNSMVPLMERLGIEIAYRATFSEDFAAAQSQTPVLVNQMQQAGVDTVLLPVGLGIASLFVNQADSQAYYPQYWTSDFASGTSDIYTVLMPASFDGALGYSSLRTGEERAGYPEVAHDKACRETFEERTGQSYGRDSTEYYSMVTACGIYKTFATAATNVGVELTRTGLSQAVQGLGDFPVPYSGLGSYRPNKFDAPDQTRLVRWHSDCRCWMPVNDFIFTPF